MAVYRSQHLLGASHKSAGSALERGKKDECHGGLGDVRTGAKKKGKKKEKSRFSASSLECVGARVTATAANARPFYLFFSFHKMCLK